MDHELKNERICLRWNDAGELSGMANLKTGRELVNAHALCRLVLGCPQLLEFESVPADLKQVEERPDSIVFHYGKVIGENGNEYAVGVDLQITLCGEEIHWGVGVKNGTDEVTVREIHYPVFSIREPEPPLKVHTSELVSTTYQDLPAMLRGRFSNYMAPDQKYIRHTSFYPGRTSSLNFYLLDYGTEILYFGCHDPEFQLTGHSFEIEKNRMINCFMARMPFLKPHGEMAENRMVTALLAERWPAGARKYRQWADSWFEPLPQSPRIRDSFGWQRLIMHHQYGEYFFRYADLPRILDSGLPSGIDTIFLFGWTKEGMDSGYPQYSPDPACGGFDELRRNILKVREKGGHVIIYYNGQLIDAASDYYRGGAGQRVSIKRADGTEHREFYNFSNTGIFTRNFGNKTFAVACPSCPEWRDILKRHIDLAYELGADGVFFDQLGLASYPCCDPSHGHPVPFTGLMQSKRDLCRELCEYAKSKDPDFAIGVECPTDQTAQYCDFIHIFGHTAQVWNPDFQRKGERPLLQCEAPLFSLAFPEIYLSDRDIRDDSDIEFRVNQLAFQQRRSDVEIYRCRADLSAASKYGAYLKQVNALRSRFKEILLHGVMTAGEGVSCSDPLVLLNTFRQDGALAVVVSQSSKERVTAELSVPGYELMDHASARNDAIVEGKNVTLPRHSLVVLYYRQSEK
jgi:hypothetical protein